MVVRRPANQAKFIVKLHIEKARDSLLKMFFVSKLF